MAADTGRNRIVYAGSRDGVVSRSRSWYPRLRRRLEQQQHCRRRRRRPSPRASSGWYSARSGNTVSDAEDHLRGGNELALARSLQHLKA
eukprot:1962073-Pleurochrysis_carterae.AAC.1